MMMRDVVKVGGFTSSTKIKKSQGIRGKETFYDIVDNVGEQLNLEAKHIKGIKLAAEVDSDQFTDRHFEGTMTEGGSIIIHAGSYFVERIDEPNKAEAKYNFEIAMAVIKITEIEFVKLGDSAVVWLDWHKKDEDERTDLVPGPTDWELYFDYTANRQLLADM